MDIIASFAKFTSGKMIHLSNNFTFLWKPDVWQAPWPMKEGPCNKHVERERWQYITNFQKCYVTKVSPIELNFAIELADRTRFAGSSNEAPDHKVSACSICASAVSASVVPAYVVPRAWQTDRHSQTL